jgi:small subunit ribosomal protein S5
MANNEQKRDEGYIEKLVQVNRVAKLLRVVVSSPSPH